MTSECIVFCRMSNTNETEIKVSTLETSLSDKISELNAGKDRRRIRAISNSRILIKPRCCPFTSCTNGRMSRHFKTAWSLLWHMSNSHKQEHNFKQEFEKIRNMVSQ